MLMEAQTLALDNADEAYKNAGLSANEYMETVTSFAASLKASTENEVEAAESANSAVIDMADNANKMGTSMESIQNAYQGFAKQNYTMLDNLKLGYGGTKEEMQRLLEDAEKLSGQKYDISNLNDVYSAIHVIQTELGITGTTAKEASTTISGSLNSMKSAWANLVTGIADDNADFDTLVENFVDSAVTASENILPRIEVAISGIGMLIEELLPVIVEKVPEIINDVLPDLIQSGSNMILSLITGLKQNSQQIMNAGADIISSLANGIIQIIPTLGSVAYDIVMNLLSGISSNSDSMLNGGSELLLQFISGISEKIPDLLVAGVDAIISLAMALTNPDTLENIVSAGIELLIGLTDGLMEALPQLLDAVPVIIARLVVAIIENAPQLLQAAIEILGKLGKFLVQMLPILLNFIPIIAKQLVEKFSQMDWSSIGRNIIDGIWNGLKNGWSWLVDEVKNLASNLFDAAKDALGIHSPSKKFKYIGEMCVAGFDEGIDDLMNTDDIARNINASISTAQSNMSGARYAGGFEGFGNFNQTINVNQPISTPDELARAVRVESRQGLMRGIAYG